MSTDPTDAVDHDAIDHDGEAIEPQPVTDDAKGA